MSGGPRSPLHTRSLWVKHSKNGLLLFAGMMALSIIIIFNFNSGEKGGRVVLSSNEKTEAGSPVMMNPRYFGVDKKNRPFTITAKSATQQKDGNISIADVTADMLLEEKNWLALTAGKGLMDQQGKHIALSGKVNMFYEGGYEFASEVANIDTEHGRAYGNQPVQGQSPTGTLKADSFDVTEQGQKLYFKGNVHVTLYLK